MKVLVVVPGVAGVLQEVAKAGRSQDLKMMNLFLFSLAKSLVEAVLLKKLSLKKAGKKKGAISGWISFANSRSRKLTFVSQQQHFVYFLS